MHSLFEETSGKLGYLMIMHLLRCFFVISPKTTTKLYFSHRIHQIYIPQRLFSFSKTEKSNVNMENFPNLRDLELFNHIYSFTFSIFNYFHNFASNAFPRSTNTIGQYVIKM